MKSAPYSCICQGVHAIFEVLLFHTAADNTCQGVHRISKVLLFHTAADNTCQDIHGRQRKYYSLAIDNACRDVHYYFILLQIVTVRRDVHGMNV